MHAARGKQGNPQACTPDQYAREAQRVFDFFLTRGQSLLDEVAANATPASEAMDFEGAAALHKQWEKVRAAALLADELVRPIDRLRASSSNPPRPSKTSPDPKPPQSSSSNTANSAGLNASPPSASARCASRRRWAAACSRSR